ncbi:MAG: Esterase [Actinomycetia bacterium]|jgi:uncharacterized protein YkwD|nr:Esterase [Actinomycetes bacterium]
MGWQTRGRGTSRQRGRTVACVLALVASVLAAPPISAHIQGGSNSPALWLRQPIVGIAATPSGQGYWRAASDGGIFTYGDAHFYGSLGALRLNRPIVGIASTPSGHGYWMVASDGGVFTFGDARFHGSLGAIRLNAPIVGIASTPSGHGYWLAASDGGVFTFGDARFHGSLGAIRLAQPIAGIATSHGGNGYWMVAHDGGIFTFGDARFYGSLGAIHLVQPIVGMTATTTGRGYLLVAADGGVFTFGDAHFLGSAARSCPDAATIGVASPRNTTGYWIGLANARTYAFTSPSSVPPCKSTPAGAIASDLLVRLNAERAARGRAPVQWDGALASYAASWSSEMSRGGFRHSNIQNLLTDGRLSYAGENIAWARGGGVSSGSLHGMWMQSAGHRDNMLSPTYNVVGIGIYCAPDGTVWATQDFGRLATAGPGAPSPVESPAPFVRSDAGGATC